MDDEGWTLVTYKKNRNNKRKRPFRAKYTESPSDVIMNKTIPDYSSNRTRFNNNRFDPSKNKIEKMSDSGETQLEYISRDISDKITTARMNKKLTQKDLANSCNLPLQIIKNYESGDAVLNSSYLNKISDILNISVN